MGIFGAYDVRGIYGKDLDEDVAQRLGLSFGNFLGCGKKIVVGMDVRESSESLKESLVEGLLGSGNNVIDIGLTATPTLYYTLISGNFDGGVMVTASHNPKEWNGFKFYDSQGFSFAKGHGLEDIERIYESGNYERRTKGYLKHTEKANEEYVKFLINSFSFLKGKEIKVMADLGNGSACLIIPKIVKKLGLNCELINEEPDGSFPNREPEPKENTLVELRREVRARGMAFGGGFDGDGDRCVFVDEEGRVITGDRVLALFLKHIGKKGVKVVYEVSCGKALLDMIKKCEAVGIESRVGRTYILHHMKKEDADLGGEYSSHFYFKELKGGDDGMYAFLKMYSLVVNKSLREMLEDVPLYPKHRIDVEVRNEQKFELIERIKELVREEGKEVVTIDGVKVLYEDGWYLIRASNTQPLLRITVEAKEEGRLKELEKEARSLVERVYMSSS